MDCQWLSVKASVGLYNAIFIKSWTRALPANSEVEHFHQIQRQHTFTKFRSKAHPSSPGHFHSINNFDTFKLFIESSTNLCSNIYWLQYFAIHFHQIFQRYFQLDLLTTNLSFSTIFLTLFFTTIFLDFLRRYFLILLRIT